MQHTLRQEVVITGIGLHSGARVKMRACPAEPGTGIIFRRVDCKPPNEIPALWDHVVDTRMCTVIANSSGVHVGTVEHVMSALCGFGVDNAIIELDGPEVPILDGSAGEFLAAFKAAGLCRQGVPRRMIRILRDVSLNRDGKSVRLVPSDVRRFEGKIDFAHPEIGMQSCMLDLVNGNYAHEVADARTFGFLHEVEAMRKSGLAKGGSMDNAIVLDNARVLNKTGLRYCDEFARHKVLDAIGDLYLAGAPILGAYQGVCAGHAMNNEILRSLFDKPDAWTWVHMSAGDVAGDHNSHGDGADATERRSVAMA